MLQRANHGKRLIYESGGSSIGADLVNIYTFLKSYRYLLSGWIIVALTAALAYAFTATPLYTAIANVAIDSRKIQQFKSKNDQGGSENSLDSSQLDSEVEFVRSRAVALAVVKKLNLSEDLEFVNPNGGTVTQLIQLVAQNLGTEMTQPTLSATDRERIASDAVLGNLSVRRVGSSYVIEISFRSADGEKAAQIANAFADAYINDELNIKYQAARRASEWLEARIAELRNQSHSAARAVEDYKESYSIVDTGGGRGLTNLQVQELNTRMINATASTAEARAKLERVEQVLKSPAPGEAVAAVSDQLHNDVITRLRQRYLDNRERIAKWGPTLGPDHQAIINLRNEMTELQSSIVDELKRIAQTYQSDYEIAKTREDSLKESLRKQVQQVGASGQAQVDLKQLESTAQAYQKIFEVFLQKYTEAVQQQSFPISDARVITIAERPAHKSSPKTALLGLLGLVAGTTFGLMHALILRNLDRAVRRPSELEERLGLECLGLVPLATAQHKKSMPKQLGHSKKMKSTGLMNKVLDEPFSHFSEGLRSVKTTLDIMALTRPMQCIGIISAIPDEGKSTIAINLANLIAVAGRSTLLIDADLRNPELTRGMNGHGGRGLLEVIAGTARLAIATRDVPKSSLRFLPSVVQTRIPNTADLLASERMRALLTDARRDFNQVILDLPPVGALPDARAISPLVDALILVVSWGNTRFEVVAEALANFGPAADKIVGVVLNKVNFRELDSLESYSHGFYYNKNYSKYGYSYAKD